MKTATTYMIYGPGNGIAEADTPEEAIRLGSRMIALSPLRYDAHLRNLYKGNKAVWAYGFESVWIVPHEWVSHLDRWYLVQAKFPCTNVGHLEEINKYVEKSHEDVTLLLVSEGIAYVTYKKDVSKARFLSRDGADSQP